MQKYNIGLRKQ